MALDISGIGNVGEFFSQHYLDALLEHDLGDTLKRWAKQKKDDKIPAPQDRLARLADSYFRIAARAEGLADPNARLELAEGFHADLLSALGYERNPSTVLLDDDRILPVLYAEQQNHRPWLWIVEAPFPITADEADPFGEAPLARQLPLLVQYGDGEGATQTLATEPWRDLFDGPVFRAENPPRWVLFVAGSDVFLLDRDKWHQGKYLHFQLARLLGLREPNALQATAGLLHREVLVPEGGQSLLEKLDEESHKHAFAVSTDLKYGAQRAIELLGNDAIRYRLEVQKKKTYDDELDVRELTRECITYLYRLLFLFYVEARGSELGVVPMDSDAYRRGYSLESLRDLELVPLTTDEARNGTFLSDSLRQLFHLIQRGHGYGQIHLSMAAPAGAERGPAPLHETFQIRGLRSQLFDEERTPILRAVKFRNQVLQEVLQLLSLSREGKGKKRGRISYAQLGINQLGAVYEGLLSYTGFFASEELHEVRDEKEIADNDARTYFVPAAKIGAYKKIELVKDEFGRPVVHAKGTFLFRLSGRDRERSASYYTPEVLTRCLTKYTLKVRLGEPLLPEDDTPELREQRLSADEILKLTLCEPAMGSGAFLNEAVTQLAEKYLEKKQAELGQTIPAEEYQRELAKVKYHFVVHNTYGVDLNPLAAELGKISLWLNVLQPEVATPYLDQRLAVGNSLIGARREVFRTDLLTAKGKDNDTWLDAVPDRVPLRDAEAPPGEDLRFPDRPPNTVYHFLVPDSGMVAYADDAVVKEPRPEESQRFREWRKAQLRRFTEAEIQRLLRISDRIDMLWKSWAVERIGRSRALRQPIQLWGQHQDEQLKAGARQPEASPRPISVEEAEEYIRDRDRKATGGAALKFVMDYWGALWFWPVLDAGLAPSREDWLGDVEALLEGGEAALRARGEGAAERTEVVRRVAGEQRFFHWELAFAEVFAVRGGMDLFLGNPPWIKVEWTEAGVLGDLEPQSNLGRLSAKQFSERRREVLSDASAASVYLQELALAQGQGSLIASRASYPLLRGVQGNLYKCFLECCWRCMSTDGSVGLWQQPGLLDDPNGGLLRRELGSRSALVARFKNELVLFPEIDNQRQYMLSISRGRPRGRVSFLMMANLFHPRTLDDSLRHDGAGAVPGIKTDDNNWDLRGHRSRVVLIDDDALALFAKLYDAPGTPPREARLPVVHSAEILDVLSCFAKVPDTLGAHPQEWFAVYDHLDESRQQKDGTIRRDTRVPKGCGEWVLSGPHFYVATPLSKTPNEGCSNTRDYSPLDLTQVPSDYLPRTNYVPACSATEFLERTPSWRDKKFTEFYRYVHRRMVAPTGERTLVPAIIPPGVTHIHTVLSVAFHSPLMLCRVAGVAMGLPGDFFVKTTGKGDLYADGISFLPTPEAWPGTVFVVRRTARLNCLTTFYESLWEEVVTKEIASDHFAKGDPRLLSWSHLTPKWTRDSALRTPYERRQALVELDALAALSLGLTEEQLLLIYRVQFPVLQQYERETYYDQRGKIVFTTNRGLSGVGLDRAQWEQIKDAPAGAPLPEWAKDGGGPFVPPFDSCDREADMSQAYRYFAEKLGITPPVS